jgi:hypothetical protein
MYCLKVDHTDKKTSSTLKYAGIIISASSAALLAGGAAAVVVMRKRAVLPTHT